MSYPLVSCHMSLNVSCPSQQLNSSTAHLSISVLSFEIFWDQCPRTDQKERRGRRGRRRRRRRRRKNQNDFSLLSSAIITTAAARVRRTAINVVDVELELELIQTQMAQKPMLRAEVGMRVRCANKASAE